MPIYTYNQCYQIAADIRRTLNEYSTGLLQGTDTSGAYQNEQIIKAINDSQRHLYHLLVKRIEGEFVKLDQNLTVSASEATLPWDLGRLKVLKNEYGRQMYPLRPDQRVPTTSTGSKRLYFRLKNRKIQIEQASVNATYKLTYIVKPREIHYGKAGAGAAASITLDANYAKLIADYYNDMNIENITQSWVDTISDYTAAKVATITETAAADDYYGIESDIPEPFHHLIAPYAAILVKNSSPVTQEKATSGEILDWNSMLLETLRAFEGTQDTDYEDVFADFEPMAPTTGVLPMR